MNALLLSSLLIDICFGDYLLRYVFLFFIICRYLRHDSSCFQSVGAESVYHEKCNCSLVTQWLKLWDAYQKV